MPVILILYVPLTTPLPIFVYLAAVLASPGAHTHPRRAGAPPPPGLGFPGHRVPVPPPRVPRGGVGGGTPERSLCFCPPFNKSLSLPLFFFYALLLLPLSYRDFLISSKIFFSFQAPKTSATHPPPHLPGQVGPPNFQGKPQRQCVGKIKVVRGEQGCGIPPPTPVALTG